MQLRWRIATGLALLLSACNSSGDGDTDTDGASGGGGSTVTASTTTGETETASDTVESASDTNSGTSSGGADSSSSGNGSAEGTSTGEGSSSSTGEGSAEGTSTGEGSSSSTGDTGSGIYGPCAGDLTCAAAFDCEEVDLRGNLGLNWCTQPCNGSGDCPDPDDGTASPICRPGAGVGDPSICALACDDETSCTSGMECYIPMGTNNGFCAFTADYVP